ncbi:MAG: ATP-binding protein [Paramuribaculum sp.]|nr:ATP-binding protein [Paramuribaculum sp.]
MEKLIGREKETNKLTEYYNSDKSEFIALYGRRRVGKTFLIRSFFKDKFDFYATGVIDGSRKTEMDAFHASLIRYGYKGEKAKTWNEAFNQLAVLLERKNKNRKRRLVVFLDELPCFDTPRSGFLQALDLFWNSRASWIENIYFVVCGSATSWMMSNIVNNRAGLHKRTTHIMHLRPFTLGQTEEYLKSRKFRWPRISILQAYMVLGGVPYYLSLLDSTKNVPDNIDSLFFSSEPELENEYDRLFHSLFKNADSYMEIIRYLSSHRDGYTRTEIANGLKIPDNGHLSRMLDDLEHCDFIRKYNNGALQKNGIYQLVDFFSLFHHKFGNSRITDEHFWRNSLGTPEQNTWYGFTFEKVCLCHIKQIVHGLRLDTIRHEYYAWRSQDSRPAVQIDLIIDRADGIATICEIKYSKDDYTVSENEYRKIIRRVNAFQEETHHKGGVQVSLVTTYGIKDNMYSEISDIPITMNELFE